MCVRENVENDLKNGADKICELELGLDSEGNGEIFEDLEAGEQIIFALTRKLSCKKRNESVARIWAGDR